MTTAGLLGTSGYAIQITGRGGRPIHGEMEWSTVDYSRLADDTGDATVSWFQGDRTVPWFLVEAEPWRHELVVWRLNEPDPVFVGPLRTCSYKAGLVTLTAKDGSTWFEKRLIKSDTTYADTDLAYIFGKIAAEALAYDESPGLQIITAPCGVTGTRVTRADESARAADLLRELSRSGVDWTVVGRQILIGGARLTDPLGALVLINEAVNEVTLEKAGDSTVTQQTIRWQTADDQKPMLTTVSTVNAHLLGLLEDLDEEGDIADATSAGTAAEARLKLLSFNPTVITCDLTADAPTTLSQLVPSRVVDFRLSELPVSALGKSRLRKVSVSVTQTDEKVSLETTPLGVTA